MASTICHPGGSGAVLPLLESEHEWHWALRLVLYSVGLIYMFYGIAIISDIFVQSIETIVGRRKQVRDKDNVVRTTKIWNQTVATLTLMAFGSSAPEIMLSTTDLFKAGFHFTPLGTSTIVGSAAFNLLIIISVCIYVIDGERRIAFLPAFCVTAVFSLVAYLWLAVMLAITSPQVVDIWEALVTFLLFPLLVYVSYRIEAKFSSDTDVVESCDDLGTLGFACECDASTLLSVRDTSKAQDVVIVIRREGDCRQPACCSCRLEGHSAVLGYDFYLQGQEDESELLLEFLAGETEKSLFVSVPARAAYRGARQFFVVLDRPVGATFKPSTDGGKNSSILTVSVGAPGSGVLCMLDRVFDSYMLRCAMKDWAAQVSHLATCAYSSEDNEQSFSACDVLMRAISAPFSVLFLAVPPTSLYGGWASFFVSLCFIGLSTIVVSDMAEMVGCVCGVADEATAITFVALGTSMPDLFASREAAMADATADASIVNVTGSNSVNVFVGLGLPWLIGSLYWFVTGRTHEWSQRYSDVANSYPDDARFVVLVSANLVYFICVFSIVCVLAFWIIYLRRTWIRAELGGPYLAKLFSSLALIFYWFIFIGVCCWRVTRWQHSSYYETLYVHVFCAVLLLVVTAPTVFVLHKSRTSLSGAGADSIAHATFSPSNATSPTNGSLRVGGNAAELVDPARAPTLLSSYSKGFPAPNLEVPLERSPAPSARLQEIHWRISL
eukprot:TRINITY_DN47432_c0_g1_i1.p1 TRINITY_DN47432_c0_g1~~TRINITY_DN47432_c0_g1_i1.p1  ORF type:complete len:724 (-),score=69.33 TRINITY_DN47432_c0_g1_i1:476-2647(-)